MSCLVFLRSRDSRTEPVVVQWRFVSRHHQHSLHGAGGKEPVARLCPRGPRENADSFIVSDRVWTHTSRLGQVSGTKSFGTAVLHHAKYQPWNAFQSQDVFEKSDCSREALYVFMTGKWLARLHSPQKRRSPFLLGRGKNLWFRTRGTRTVQPKPVPWRSPPFLTGHCRATAAL